MLVSCRWRVAANLNILQLTKVKHLKLFCTTQSSHQINLWNLEFNSAVRLHKSQHCCDSLSLFASSEVGKLNGTLETAVSKGLLRSSSSHGPHTHCLIPFLWKAVYAFTHNFGSCNHSDCFFRVTGFAVKSPPFFRNKLGRLEMKLWHSFIQVPYQSRLHLFRWH